MWHNQFFIFFHNIHFNKYIQDQYFYNKKHQFNYTTNYICLINTSIDTQFIKNNVKSFNKSAKVVFRNWKYYYLNLNQVNLFVILRLKQKDFKLTNIKFKYYKNNFKHIISLFFGKYFAKKSKTQKVWHNNKP